MLVQLFNDSAMKWIINPLDISKTSITTLFELYEFPHMLFGLTNADPTFQPFSDEVTYQPWRHLQNPYNDSFVCPLAWRMLVQLFNDSSPKGLINPENICKTPISILFELLEFPHMPFGLKNAGPTFQRFIDEVTYQPRRHLQNPYNDCFVCPLAWRMLVELFTIHRRSVSSFINLEDVCKPPICCVHGSGNKNSASVDINT